jgi:tetratricopeptide (TPR) repeat protein
VTLGATAREGLTVTIDVRALWDFADPAASEARFREALSSAEGDDALVLETQIARTYGLRRDPEHARAVLDGVRARLDGAGPEPAVRYQLELGRTWISAVTTPAERTPDAIDAAREAYGRAFDLACDAGLDDLAIDSVHMLAIVDTGPQEQLAWIDKGLALAAASSQPAARRWEASLRNNRGMALHEQGQRLAALDEFRQALVLRQAEGDPASVRVAWWMVAWSLRGCGELDEALEIQLRLERECADAGEPDPFVFEELELLYGALGDEDRASHYRSLGGHAADANPDARSADEDQDTRSAEEG